MKMISFLPVNKIPGLSVIVIALNEEHDIEGCLESVREIAEEIIVVDSGSEDRTVEISRKYTDRIFHNIWTGYGPQKQFALDQAKGPWVLNIDADERVSDKLRDEIRKKLAGNTHESGENAYDLSFHHYFLGRRLRFGGVQGESHVRLFRKDRAAYGKTKVHEGIEVAPPIGRLSGTIDHFSYRDVSDYLKKCNWYTSLSAGEKFSNGERFAVWHHLRLPWEFIVRYIFKLGFLDGEAGLTYALLSSYYVWLKFVKLRDLEDKQK
jgi:glycosyltransferase involved in cell wall biosynthesis